MTNIRINWIKENDGYIAAWIENDEVIYSAFDEVAEDAYYELVNIMCLAEMYNEYKKKCLNELKDYNAFRRD